METQLSRAEKLDRLFGTPAFAVIIAILCNAMGSRCSGGSIWGRWCWSALASGW